MTSPMIVTFVPIGGVSPGRYHRNSTTPVPSSMIASRRSSPELYGSSTQEINVPSTLTTSLMYSVKSSISTTDGSRTIAYQLSVATKKSDMANMTHNRGPFVSGSSVDNRARKDFRPSAMDNGLAYRG